MRLSSVLISSYKCWQENKDARTLLYFYKRFAWKKNLRHVISFFFFSPCLALSVGGQPRTSKGTKEGGLAALGTVLPHRSGHVPERLRRAIGCSRQYTSLLCREFTCPSSPSWALRFRNHYRWSCAMPHHPAVQIWSGSGVGTWLCFCQISRALREGFRLPACSAGCRGGGSACAMTG